VTDASIDKTAVAPGARRGRLGLAAAVAVSLVAIWLGASYGREGPVAAAPPAGLTVGPKGISLDAGAPQWRFLKLATAEAARDRWTDSEPARITIDQARASKVGVAVAGRVTRVFVELGQRVTRGEPLFAVASPEIATLEAEREKAGVELEAARSTFERVQALVATRALPAKEETNARHQLEEAEVGQRLAAAKMVSLKVSPGAGHEFTVPAPRDGVVVEKSVLVDQQVSPDSSGTLMAVADLSSVWVIVDLFESEALALRPGVAARVTCPSLPGMEEEGRVEMVSSVVDPARHTLPVRIRLANPQGLLRPNLYARVRFAAAPPRDAVEVPTSAVLSDGERQYVYVEDGGGRFARREVSVGAAHEGRVAVLSGLRAGETVAAEGAILLDNELQLGS
jgi:cobalt-zinc-cadmium efflux system membrane fusion protein